jgi:hypothetical protein
VTKRDTFRWVWDPTPTNPEHIVILGGWAESNIAQVRFDELGRSLNINQQFERPLRAFLRDVERAGMLHELGPMNGAWAPRFIRQTGSLTQRKAKCATLALNKRSDKLSNHAHGLAVDFDAKRYPLGYAPPLADSRWELARIARTHGIRCGIEYVARPDAQHFELL